MTTPYTYFLRNKLNGKKYYGVKYAKNCHPDNLFKTYFTSSKIIQNIIKQYGKDIFEVKIHKIFSTPNEACLFENKFIRRIRAHQKEDWYNRTINGSDPVLYSKGVEPWNKGISNISTKNKKFYNNGEIQKMLFEHEVPVGWNKGRLNNPWNKGLTKKDPRVKLNIENTKKTLKENPRKAWNKGKTKFSDERILKYANKGSIKTKCPHCDKIGGANVMRRFHFNNCKMKKDSVFKKKVKI